MSGHYVISGGNKRRYAKNDAVRTPDALFRQVAFEFGVTLDVAADSVRHMTPTFFNEAQNGLTQPWAPHVCWLNPPYSNIAPWLEKAIAECRKGATVIALLPVRTSLAWFHELVLPFAEIRFIRGRLKWENHTSTAPFASMLCIYRPSYPKTQPRPQ